MKKRDNIRGLCHVSWGFGYQKINEKSSSVFEVENIEFGWNLTLNHSHRSTKCKRCPPYD